MVTATCHYSGDVDFGAAARIEGQIAADCCVSSRAMVDRWLKPARLGLKQSDPVARIFLMGGAVALAMPMAAWSMAVRGSSHRNGRWPTRASRVFICGTVACCRRSRLQKRPHLFPSRSIRRIPSLPSVGH